MFADIEDAVITQCKNVIGDHVKTVEDLPGRWSQKTLHAALRQTPGVFVTWANGKGDGNTTQATMAARYVVYVVTSHASGERERRRGNQRQIGAYELIERVVPAVHGMVIRGVGTLALETIDNLYSDRFDKEGVVVYGVAFKLNVTFPPAFDINDLHDFALYTGTHRVGGDDDRDMKSRAEPDQTTED